MKQFTDRNIFVYLFMAVLVGLGLVFSLAVQPVMANPLAQAAATPTAVMPTVTATVGITATTAAVGTATTVPTLAPPAATGTPKAIVPVTGADLTPPSPQPIIALWVVLGLLGLFLIVFGLRFGRSKR